MSPAATAAPTGATRTESDTFGPIEVPADRLWGAQTQRSIQNFPIGVDRFKWQRPVIRALGILKKSAAQANADLGELSREVADPIVRAADEVIAGHPAQRAVREQDLAVAHDEHAVGQQFERRGRGGVGEFGGRHGVQLRL